MLRKYVLGLCLALFPLFASASRTMVIEAQPGEIEGVAYRVDGRSLNFDQLGEALNLWMQAKPGDKNEIRIVVLASGKIPLSTLYNLNGLVKQIGFNGPRFFYTADEGSNKLSEIQINHRPLVMKGELEKQLAVEQP